MSLEVDYSTDTENYASEDSFHTIRHHLPSSTHSRTIMSDTQAAEPETRVFGTALQKFSKDLIKALSAFKFSDLLTDDNYVSWSQAVSELLQSIDLNLFLTSENFFDVGLSDLENKKTRFILTTFVLNHLDTNNNLQARNHLSNPADPHTLVYDPYKVWYFLKN